MSLRRSQRAQVQRDSSAMPNGHAAEIKGTAPPQKRGRTGQMTETMVSAAVALEESPTDTMQPPSTPNKRRKMASDTQTPAPPVTPTPAAVNLMLGNTGMKKRVPAEDVNTNTPIRGRRSRTGPDQSNATLVTPGGTHVQPNYSTFEESPTKSSILPFGEKQDELLNAACTHLTTVDPGLQAVVTKHRCEVFSSKGLAEEIDPFRSLASGIMAQQVSGAAAKSIKNKFVALFPEEERPNGFPRPSVVASTPLPTLRTAGLSQRKAEYIQGLAEKFTSGELTVPMLMTGSDETVMEKLVAVRGLGRWSVEMFMCFGLKRTDIFSTGDLGVQRGMAAYVGRDVKRLKAKGGGKWKYMSEKDMLEISEKFRPYRSLFMWYMWRIEDVDVDAIQDN